MILAATAETTRTERLEPVDGADRSYIESTPCIVMRAVDLSALIPARYATPRTIHEYLT